MSWKFTHWCHHATRRIKYKPDREAVSRELKQHMDDRYDTYLQHGLSRDDAVERTLQAMGDAEEIAPQLAAIHRPFWPYLLLTSRVLLIILLILSIVPLWEYFSTLHIRQFPKSGDYFTMTEIDENYRRIFYAEPGTSAVMDGYQFAVTQVAVWQVDREGEEYPIYSHNFRIKVTNPLLWSEQSNAVAQLWGKDNLGNYYYCANEQIYGKSSIAIGTYFRTGIFSYTYELFLQKKASVDAGQLEWIDLHYDRDGRNMVLRIPFAGGVEP